MDGDRGRHPVDDELVEGAKHAVARLLAIDAAHDEFREQGIVVSWDVAPGGDAAVHANERPARLHVSSDPSRSGEEVPPGILGVDAAFDRVAVGCDPQACERATKRDLDLEGDHIEARHHLGDGVLDLDPRVHLQEVEGAVLVEDALDRTGVDIPGLLRERDRSLCEPLAKSFIEERRRRFLDQFLVTSLDGAIALPEERDVPLRIGHDLRFDVPRVVDVALQEDLGAPEVRLRLAGRTVE